MSVYDLIVIGGGPAGLTAGLYATRARLKTLLIEKLFLGGQAASTYLVENYPGFPDGILGPDLTQAMEKQAKRFGLEVINGEVKYINPQEKLWEVGGDEQNFLAKAIIIASGVESVKLGIPGEEELRGRGVSYCATCDGPFFKDQEVGVIGGGDSAVDEAIYLTRFAQKVYIIHRRDNLRATKILQERALQNKKITILWDTVATKILGQERVEGLELKNVKTQEKRLLPVKGVFFYVGLRPMTNFLKDLIKLDERGYIITDENMATSVPGIFAAGDVRQKLLRQVATAVGDGATAAFAVERYLERL
ncbi:MAG: thioredoxin-disulfide reductase [Thermodesulfobacteriota bacterium]